MPLNIHNILRVANAIEAGSVPGLGFNMGTWHGPGRDRSGHNCKTAACIGGWTEVVFPKEYAHVTLGLDDNTHGPLFYPISDACDATPAHAARVLRILAITGEVNWSAAMDPTDPVLPPVPAPAATGKATVAS